MQLKISFVIKMDNGHLVDKPVWAKIKLGDDILEFSLHKTTTVVEYTQTTFDEEMSEYMNRMRKLIIEAYQEVKAEDDKTVTVEKIREKFYAQNQALFINMEEKK